MPSGVYTHVARLLRDKLKHTHTSVGTLDYHMYANLTSWGGIVDNVTNRIHARNITEHMTESCSTGDHDRTQLHERTIIGHSFGGVLAAAAAKKTFGTGA